ncbi:hypothetical protein GGS23DRAFT_38009 [Durotheca rogersii]|uniref:uncharacterized protein n=1 Tax=Durotheca rogersii TaxID=419775 RepID=UPI0022210D2C|nr:uncharacterized protein GGS23DRAFT_38009 [Durotheca rogersii]KAI5868581.1 hypothetical protein GGS23DRAFT_38009 [Durotheca rogersii]
MLCSDRTRAYAIRPVHTRLRLQCTTFFYRPLARSACIPRVLLIATVTAGADVPPSRTQTWGGGGVGNATTSAGTRIRPPSPIVVSAGPPTTPSTMTRRWQSPTSPSPPPPYSTHTNVYLALARSEFRPPALLPPPPPTPTLNPRASPLIDAIPGLHRRGRSVGDARATRRRPQWRQRPRPTATDGSLIAVMVRGWRFFFKEEEEKASILPYPVSLSYTTPIWPRPRGGGRHQERLLPLTYCSEDSPRRERGQPMSGSLPLPPPAYPFDRAEL